MDSGEKISEAARGEEGQRNLGLDSPVRTGFSGPDVLAEYATDTYPEAEYIFAGGQRIAKVQSKDDTPRPAVSMRVESAGFDDGFYARLYVDGTDYSLNQRGYNLVVIDESGGTVVDQVSFDTYGSTANAEAMADYIDALPYGRIVLAGIKDDGSLNMTENAYLALESLGSVKCRDVGYRDSHAFIGRVGVLPGTVEEEHVPSSSGPAEVEAHKVDCRVQSAGFDDGFLVNLFVNGVDVSTNGRGHNLVVIDESSGSVLNAVSYDTYASSTAADAMATFINGLASGRIVLAGISDDGSVSMTENAYQALESLGSAATRNVAYRDSWAMIGVKGAAIGTVPELHTKRFSAYAEVSQEAPSVQHLVDGFHFYYTDHLNSTRMLDDWDPGQAEMQVDYYYPLGEINTQSGGGEDTHYKFTGYEEDTGTGLHYAKARFYNPELGRFLTPDPAGQYFSPYAYVGNRPLVYVDPDGEFGFLAIAAGALFASWVAGNVIEGFSQASDLNVHTNVPLGGAYPIYGSLLAQGQVVL